VRPQRPAGTPWTAGTVTVLGQDSPLGAEVCRALTAGGYRPGASGPRMPALIIASELAVPAGPLISRHRRRRGARQCREFVRAARLARDRGASRLVGLSSAFIFGRHAHMGSDRSWLCGAPPETAQALAAEAAAEAFTELGGTSVVLRLGWTYGQADRLTRQILQTAARGWQLLDGPHDACVPMVEISDAAAAAVAALAAPPGLYYVTDGHARNQRELAQIVQDGLGRELHTLADGRWGRGRLFGSSRLVDGSPFRAVTGWRPCLPDAAEQLRHLCRTFEDQP
jgi:nucleoside-diphosphate-sugar epimerase